MYQYRKTMGHLVGVSNQQPDLAMVTFVGIFDIFQRMSISNYMEVREVLIFEDGG
jgi:hypothetical protein